MNKKTKTKAKTGVIYLLIFIMAILLLTCIFLQMESEEDH